MICYEYDRTEWSPKTGKQFTPLLQLRQTQFLKHKNEPAHEIMVLITQATSEGSDEPASTQSRQSLCCSHT